MLFASVSFAFATGTCLPYQRVLCSPSQRDVSHGCERDPTRVSELDTQPASNATVDAAAAYHQDGMLQKIQAPVQTGQRFGAMEGECARIKVSLVTLASY